MLLAEYIMSLQNCDRKNFNFKLGDDLYNLSSFKPEIILDESNIIVFDLHKSNNCSSSEKFLNLMFSDYKDAFFHELFFKFNHKLYNLTSLV